MRFTLFVSVLLLLAAGIATAGGDPTEPDRVARLEHELRVARLEADVRRELNAHLLTLLDDLFARLGEHPSEGKGRASTAQDEELRLALQREQDRHAQDVTHLQEQLMEAQQQLEEQRMAAAHAAQVTAKVNAYIPALKDAIRQLRADLGAEQERHAADVSQLQQALAKVHQRAEEERLSGTQAAQQAAMLRQEFGKTQAQLQTHKAHVQAAVAKANAEAQRAIELSKEMDRLKWNFVKGAPSDTVVARLGDLPAAHWRAELASKDALRARVALSVLTVVPDPSPDGVELVLLAASHHRELLDRATQTLVRVGPPAVEKLVAAARAEKVPVAWAAHVLSEMGPDAKEALPWLAEIAEREGRDAAAAERAIQKVAGAKEDNR